MSRNRFISILCLLDDGHLVDEMLAAAQLVEDEEHVADVQRDAALQVVIEVDVAAQRFPVAVEGAADEVAFAVNDRAAGVAARDVVGRQPVMSLVVRKQTGIVPSAIA